MKRVLMGLMVLLWSAAVYSQPATKAKGRTTKKIRTRPAEYAQPRETATERYLKGPARKTGAIRNDSAGNTASPFATGIYVSSGNRPAFDSATRGAYRKPSGAAIVAGGNDTVFNANIINENGTTTISGAVDRSGQAQFGQTNWGSSRSTIGESQWTVPPPVTSSFSRSFPQVNNATWWRNNADTTVYAARYQAGTSWVTSTYNSSGQPVATQTEFTLGQAPRVVHVYLSKQLPGWQVVTIYKLQVPGKPDVYQLQTKTGNTIYLNMEGMEVNY